MTGQPVRGREGAGGVPAARTVVAVTPKVARAFAGELGALPPEAAVRVLPEAAMAAAGRPKSPPTLRARLHALFGRAGRADGQPTPAFDQGPVEEATGLVVDWGVQDGIAALLEGLPRLSWIHVVKTGVDHLPLDLLRARKLRVTCSKGAYSEAVAEFAMGLLYLFSKRYLEHFARPEADAVLWGRSLRGEKLLVLGTGHIGSQLAKLAAGAGLTVLGVNSSGRPVEGFSHTVPWERSGESAAGCGLVADCLPLTAATRGAVGRELFARLSPGACYVNVGRVETVDQRALSQALRERRLAFAALDAEASAVRLDRDVRQKVLVTHHSAYATEESRAGLAALVAGNIAAFAAGRELAGLVDLDAGY
ncbi:D-isomer specific 2-hydroxyacid dehydrogenase NAD-binding protein [Desulfovibrio sp. X2]|uniref:NAD(P)-dependent oxidoreductase n=1 Tax=Desulfovibrio sp. X2 TaxID=941449 RepID=UPI0003588582|nr:NAD(P)-dependent oxidoreductase [Desulfovibrio sp. X2]EPR37231.1 D-isomer specific 2-hydroxyacid dehydrogenase NAD-binding protein [Desulfovibrio sp. X2]